MSDCAATPTTVTDWETIILSKTTYTALPLAWTFNGQGPIYETYTYPALTMTMLKPGDQLTFVMSLSNGKC